MKITRTCIDCGCLFTPKHGGQELCLSCVNTISRSLAPKPRRYACLLACLCLALSAAAFAQVSGPHMLSIPGDGAVQVVRSAAPALMMVPEDIPDAALIFYAEDYVFNPGGQAQWPSRVNGITLVNSTESQKPRVATDGTGLHFSSDNGIDTGGQFVRVDSNAGLSGASFTYILVFHAEIVDQYQVCGTDNNSFMHMTYLQEIDVNQSAGSIFISSTLGRGLSPMQNICWTTVVNGANSEVYKNGVFDKATAHDGVIGPTANQGFTIGRSWAAWQKFTGIVAFLAIYERVLTSEEITGVNNFLMDKYLCAPK